MSKIEKKKKRLQERIDELRNELRIALTKKDSSTKEIDIPSQQRKILDLQKQFNEL